MGLRPYAGLAILLGGSAAWAQWGRGYSDGWGPGHMMGGWGFGGGIFMIIFWILIIVGLVVLIRWLVVSTRSHQAVGGPAGPAQTNQAQTNQARDILRERFARGEIDQAEFEEKKRLLAAD